MAGLPCATNLTIASQIDWRIRTPPDAGGHPFADHDTAARKLVELTNAFESVQDGRIYIEKINGPFLFQLKGTPAEYKAGLDLAIAKGWLLLHESGTYVKFTEAGAALFA